jgi:putative ABC transport system substrate-binding protein
MTNRREFITLLGGGAAAWPLAARAQQRERLPIIGILGSATPAVQGQNVSILIERLRRLGWIDGRTVGIESRWAEGRAERFAEIAAEFVRLNVRLIVTVSPTPFVVRRLRRNYADDRLEQVREGSRGEVFGYR